MSPLRHLVNMFPLFDQDLPHIEQKIISYLGPADIVRCRKVCKKWARLMQSRRGIQMKLNRLFNRVLLLH